MAERNYTQTTDPREATPDEATSPPVRIGAVGPPMPGSALPFTRKRLHTMHRPLVLFGVQMPHRVNTTWWNLQDSVGDTWNGAKDLGLRMRHQALQKAPHWLVNNSSNVIAGMHLAAETLMFKANGNNMMDEQRKDKLIYYVIDPPRRIWKSFIGDAHLPKRGDFKSVFTAAKWQHAITELRDVEGATQKGLAALKPGEVLHNHWQGRATLTGVIGWGIPFLSPDYKDKEEDVERNIEKATKHPLLFGASRLKDAVWYPFDTAIKLVKKASDPKTDHEIGKNKLQFTGLGVTIYGIWSTIGAWRNTGKHAPGHALAGKRYYYFNPMYLATGLISIFAGIPPLFATNNEKGWVGFGTHMQLRSIFLPFSIYKKFKNHDAGVGYYTAAHAIFQTHNGVASLVGGAKKLPDGTLIDHTQERAAARERALEEKHAAKRHTLSVDSGEMLPVKEHATPTHHVSGGTSLERLATAPVFAVANG